MKYLIGIDGGGTKTESVLFNEYGEVLGRSIVPGVNALDVGIDLAKERMAQAIDSLLAMIPAGEKPSVIYGGLAAAVDYFPGVMISYLNEKYPDIKFRMEGDGGVLIAAVQGHSDGASLIAGTGSSLYIRKDDRLQRFGGWSPLIDTEGSGYKLALHAFYHAFRALDGRGPKTVLYDLIEKQLGDKPENCLPEICSKGRPFIATFAHCIFEGRKMGDEVATMLFNDGVKFLAELIEVGDRELGHEFNVYCGGGLFFAFPEYFEELKKVAPKRAKLIKIDAQPVYGAAVEAMWDIGKDADDKFKQTFLQSYDKIVKEQDAACGGRSAGFDNIYG